MEKGKRRWIVDISLWSPSVDEFSSIKDFLTPHDCSAINSFVRFEDRKRALVSRLLQYSLLHEVFGLPINRIIIDRTALGKPYLKNEEVALFPNFNFSLSHHGKYIGIASEPLYLVGFDIVSHDTHYKEAGLDFINSFASHFTTSEWEDINSTDSPDKALVYFYNYWSLKEAFIKAIGAGLGYGLQRLDFHHVNWAEISVYIDGVESKDWRFWHFQIDQKHWASLARGLPRYASEGSDETPSTVGHEVHDCWNELQVPDEEFRFMKVVELIRALKEEA
ncbi:hypothetical protein HPP92_018209 [Vanilla planifolia]|uniref:holo-[acyl-carrier-protein] synthase n=1 Tax=Vanilla planifolia TaxID=51239 RepID=A0A835UKL3_VANPL|nr:hypothetical protein HPP92_018209 [Vanilla planifolia]